MAIFAALTKILEKTTFSFFFLYNSEIWIFEILDNFFEDSGNGLAMQNFEVQVELLTKIWSSNVELLRIHCGLNSSSIKFEISPRLWGK